MSAPEGIRTPNLLIRRDHKTPNRHHRRRPLLAILAGVCAGHRPEDAPGRGVTVVVGSLPAPSGPGIVGPILGPTTESAGRGRPALNGVRGPKRGAVSPSIVTRATATTSPTAGRGPRRRGGHLCSSSAAPRDELGGPRDSVLSLGRRDKDDGLVCGVFEVDQAKERRGQSPRLLRYRPGQSALDVVAMTRERRSSKDRDARSGHPRVLRQRRPRPADPGGVGQHRRPLGGAVRAALAGRTDGAPRREGSGARPWHPAGVDGDSFNAVDNSASRCR